jgi:hypothetical protein
VAIRLKGQMDGHVAARLASLPVCEIFLPLKFSYLYGSEGGGRKIGWVRPFSGANRSRASRHDRRRSAARGAHGPPRPIRRPPSSVLRQPSGFHLFQLFYSSARLLLPLCPRSVISVPKSDSDFCAFCAFSRPTPAIRRTRSARPTLAILRPSPASSVSALRGLCDKIRLRRPSPASSVSALRGLCEKIRRPSSVIRPPSSVLRSLPFLLFKSFRVFRVFRGPTLRPPPSDFAPLAPLCGQPSVRPVCKIFLPLKFSYLYGSEGGGRKIGW